jgi:heat shock protein HslJ
VLQRSWARGYTELARPVPRLAPVPTKPRLAAAIAILIVIGSLAACASGAAPASTPGMSPDPAPGAGGLAGRAFLSVAVTDGGVDRPLVPGTRIRLDFTNGGLSASAGCNTMGARSRIDGGRLIVDQMSTTDMGCSAALGAQDAWLATFLTSMPDFTLAGTDFTLSSGSIVLRLQDRRVVEPDQPLVGTTWTLDSIISGDVVSSVPSDAIATVAFNADGTLTVFTGCNQGGAKWGQVVDGLQITELVLTKKACSGSGGQLEAAVVAVLRAGTITVEIKADSLTLQAGSSGPAGPTGLGFRAS